MCALLDFLPPLFSGTCFEISFLVNAKWLFLPSGDKLKHVESAVLLLDQISDHGERKLFAHTIDPYDISL